MGKHCIEQACIRYRGVFEWIGVAGQGVIGSACAVDEFSDLRTDVMLQCTQGMKKNEYVLQNDKIDEML